MKHNLSNVKTGNIENTLIIRDLSMYFDNEVLDKYENINFVSPLRELNLFWRIVRKILSAFNMFLPYFFGQWVNDLENYDKIILFAGYSKKDLRAKCLNEILKNKSEKKMIYWYWNPVQISTQPSYIRNNAKGFELWSFDLDDCNEHNLNYNTTFYSKYVKCPVNAKQYDVYFVGRNKGRLLRINQIKKTLTYMGIIYYTYIVDENINNQKPFLNPKQNIENISKSKAVLEITQEGQAGLTLRTMESIFLEKKLITTNKTIKDYPFYSSKNIFIIGFDNKSNLTFFLNHPYEHIPKDKVYYYDIENWVNRFS